MTRANVNPLADSGVKSHSGSLFSARSSGFCSASLLLSSSFSENNRQFLDQHLKFNVARIEGGAMGVGVDSGAHSQLVPSIGTEIK
jgi:hypothetical protein